MSENPKFWDNYSRLFLVPKPLKRWRPVINLSILNSHLNAPTFKMETAESIRKWDSKRGVGHLDRPHRRLFSCSNSSTILKISEISNQNRGFPISGTPFWCRNSSPRVYSDCERGKTRSSSQESQNPSVTGQVASSVTQKDVS